MDPYREQARKRAEAAKRALEAKRGKRNRKKPKKEQPDETKERVEDKTKTEDSEAPVKEETVPEPKPRKPKVRAVYRTKDGDEIQAVLVMDGGDELAIKDVNGKMWRLKKDDVTKVK